MNVGQEIIFKQLTYKDTTNLFKFLRVMHLARVAHLDLRSANILKFGDSIQAIDYGLSRFFGEDAKLDLHNKGAQWLYLGQRVKEEGKVELVDDFHMLINAILAAKDEPQPPAPVLAEGPGGPHNLDEDDDEEDDEEAEE